VLVEQVDRTKVPLLAVLLQTAHDLWMAMRTKKTASDGLALRTTLAFWQEARKTAVLAAGSAVLPQMGEEVSWLLACV